MSFLWTRTTTNRNPHEIGVSFGLNRPRRMFYSKVVILPSRVKHDLDLIRLYLRPQRLEKSDFES